MAFGKSVPWPSAGVRLFNLAAQEPIWPRPAASSLVGRQSTSTGVSEELSALAKPKTLTWEAEETSPRAIRAAASRSAPISPAVMLPDSSTATV